ncbi:DUF3422 family protein [Primorskyibacter sp. S187A]|uniref:DUF3422 family protein n=1 Tax=Primorskyibacter sp. S187A TaxID=3415130 RepID=UPI003C7A3B73
MSGLTDHTLRYQLANELHARPFPRASAPGRAVYLVLKSPGKASQRDRDADRQHLTDLLDRFGAPHPQPGATHYSNQLGQHYLKWESHTEVVTYTVIMEGAGERPFDPADFDVFPGDWLAQAPGERISSALVRIEPDANTESIRERVTEWFVSESVAVSQVLAEAAVIAGDFRIDPAGHMRFAIFPRTGCGPSRTGRILQRLAEIETYKALSMLGFAEARRLSPEISQLDARLSQLMSDMTDRDGDTEATLRALLEISTELEALSAAASFRFAATKAYEAIVEQRIEVLRESQFNGRQTFREFMTRRYDPAMRTVASTETRIKSMADRAMRAGELLRTSVEVTRSAQNQQLLESMNKRADMQLRLQKTVEGLSVVAISYYAVSLAGYLLYPVADAIDVSRGLLLAAVTLPVVGLVWLAVRRIRHLVEHQGPGLD